MLLRLSVLAVMHGTWATSWQSLAFCSASLHSLHGCTGTSTQWYKPSPTGSCATQYNAGSIKFSSRSLFAAPAPRGGFLLYRKALSVKDIDVSTACLPAYLTKP